MSVSETKPDTLMDLMEKGLRDILENENSTVDQRLQAIAAGTKVMAIKYKQPEEAAAAPKSFFDKGQH